MYSVEIKNNKEIYDFCMLNGITDINKFIQECFKQGFDIKRYGLLGVENIPEKIVEYVEKEVPIEVIKYVEKETIREVPIEVIKEVEKEVIKTVYIEKEVPIEKIVEVIKEIQVDKIVKVPIEVEKVVEIVKEVPIYISGENTTQIVERIIEVPINVEKIVEVPIEVEKIVNKEVIVEKIVEVPIEIEKIVEVIKEVEKPNDKMGMLQETLMKLRREMGDKDKTILDLNNKIEQLEKLVSNTGAVYMKGSNLSQNL